MQLSVFSERKIRRYWSAEKTTKRNPQKTHKKNPQKNLQKEIQKKLVSNGINQKFSRQFENGNKKHDSFMNKHENFQLFYFH